MLESYDSSCPFLESNSSFRDVTFRKSVGGWVGGDFISRQGCEGGNEEYDEPWLLGCPFGKPFVSSNSVE